MLGNGVSQARLLKSCFVQIAQDMAVPNHKLSPGQEQPEIRRLKTKCVPKQQIVGKRRKPPSSTHVSLPPTLVPGRLSSQEALIATKQLRS